MESLKRWEMLGESQAWVKEAMRELSEKERHDAFYKTLEFGTGGMRGILGVGPNRMNLYTVAKTNMGFGKYLRETFSDVENPKVAIAYDNRHQSFEFAQISGRILSNFGIASYIFKDPRPTPELSFAVRELGCIGGIVITASHNPKEYNGYKVYDETGCQLVDHKIAKVIEYVNEIEDETSVDLSIGDSALVHELDEAFDRKYLDRLKDIVINNEEKKVRIVFSSQHGTSYPLVPNVLTELGYDVTVVKEQEAYDPNFSHTKSPNPEEKASFELALRYADEVDAHLILVCDPDADRMGIALRHKGVFEYLSGNQGGALLQEYIYSNKVLGDNPIMFNTIVTSDIGEKIARSYGVEVEKTLTGFKYIGEKIEQSVDKSFVFGYEESYGYLLADFVRDKDALQACIMVAEMTNHYLLQDKTLVDVLYELYDKHGAYVDRLESLSLGGQEGLERIGRILEHFRTKGLEGFDVVLTQDYLASLDSKGKALDFPKSNVLKFFLSDGSWVAIRPSGTEPKCKFYFCVRDNSIDEAEEKYLQISSKLNTIISGIS
jgi:phosphoglucomutase